MRGINLDRLIIINQNVFVLQKSPTVILILLLTKGKLSKAFPLNALGKQVAKITYQHQMRTRIVRKNILQGSYITLENTWSRPLHAGQYVFSFSPHWSSGTGPGLGYLSKEKLSFHPSLWASEKQTQEIYACPLISLEKINLNWNRE